MHIDHSKASNREEKVPRYEGNQLLNAESEIKPIPQMYKTCSKEHCHQDTTWWSQFMTDTAMTK